MVLEPLVKDLLEAGVHFGHQTHRWNPKMKRFIFGAKNGIYLVDLEKTAQNLKEGQEFLRRVAAEGAAILFVGTKRQAQTIIAEEAARCGQFYVNLRWLGGLLTNFQTIRKSLARLKTLRGWKEDGTLQRMTKKEAAQVGKEIARSEKVLGGIIEMGRLPRALYVVDAKREETAVREATRLGIPVVALVDTNSDPDPIAYPIPGNDDALRSIKLVTSKLADAILEGRQAYLAGVVEKEREQEAQRRREQEAQEAALAQEAAGKEAQPDLHVAVEADAEQILPESIVKTKGEGAPTSRKKRAKPKESQGEGKPSSG